ncbi:unnamed protein product [Moneuplotes crassus]|uniref:FAD-binding domain-containing protein n=1 Tax=Euplotes crassus TaxID=5936 RepID=A0AAD1X3E0_EUPCR|nr:unnamed protein product [Moneuplotes crassus]
MLANNIKTRACIVGAGPVGMSVSLLLKKFGIDSVVLERAPGISPHPKAHVIMPRTMEIMRGIEEQLEQDVINAAPPREQWTSYRYCRHVLDLDPYGIHNHFNDGIQKEMDKFKEYSLSKVVHLSQNKFCRVLKDRLLQEKMMLTDNETKTRYSPLLFNHNFIDYEIGKEDHKIRVRAVDIKNSEIRNIQCKYLIGCEGVHSKIRESIGGELIGHLGISDFINIHFRSKQLGDAIKKKNVHAMLYFIYNTKIATILVNHSTEDGEFVLQTPYFPPIQQLEDVTDAEARRMVLSSINSDRNNGTFFSPDLEPPEITEIDEILGVGHWTMSACASDVMGDHMKNVYLAGDSAHSVPPAGGYGMNAGISDAHNLAFKIADAEHNSNTEGLKFYNKERGFINKLTAKYAKINFQKGENIVNKLNVDLGSFKSFSKTIYDSVPSIVSSTFGKSAVNFAQSTALKLSMQSHLIEEKKKYLEDYENGIALLFPNLEYSYSYPVDDEHEKRVERFLNENYDKRKYIPVNSTGSLLPLFSLWCPHEKQVFQSREYVYQYQNEEKKPYYFLFKFGKSSEDTKDIEWIEGDTTWVEKIMNSSQECLHIAHVLNTQDPASNDKDTSKVFEVQSTKLGLDSTRPGCVLVRPDGHIIAKGYC